jgi:predicted metal-binding membrane protein
VNALRAHRGLLGVSAVVFLVSAITTVLWCGSMASMPGMEMPGGWTMSMAWMRMPGQGWLGAGATFIGMWMVMMVAMMLPVLVPMLVGYRLNLGALVAAGYFFVWTLVGVAIYPLGIMLAAAEMRLPALASAVPFVAGVVVIFAGLTQFTAWKKRQLACCRTTTPDVSATDVSSALRQGLRLGLRCIYCCANMTAVLLVTGVMNHCAMAIVAAATAAERNLPQGLFAPHAVGSLIIAGGIWLIACQINH